MENQPMEIAIMNDYPESEFNLLVPVKTIQELSPLHKLVFNQVMISSNLKDKDVYKQGEELALTKKGLEKLMTASNIQIVESVPIMPKICRKCVEIAKATKIAPKCGECKSKNDVAYRVTVSIPDSNGGFRYVQASKNSKTEDAKSATEKLFLDEQCETKALNRALRKAMMIKSTYTVKELEKPFVVANVVVNMADADMKKAMIAKATESSNILFEKKFGSKMLSAPIEIVPEDDEENQELETVDAEIVEDDGVYCQGCGQQIESGNGKWTVEAIAEYSKKHFGKVLCIDCQDETRASKPTKAGNK